MIQVDGALSILDRYKWLAIALPGIIAAGTTSLITSNILRFSEIQILIIGVIISIPLLIFCALTIYSLILLVNLGVKAVQCWKDTTIPNARVSARAFYLWSLLLALLVSPVVGVHLAVLLERDTFHAIARRVNLLRYWTDPAKRSNWHLDAESIWSPLEQLLFANTRGELGNAGKRLRTRLDNRDKPFSTGTAYFEVGLKTGRGFVGWPRLYGRRGSETEIFLSPVCEVFYEKQQRSVRPVNGPGVLIKERELGAVPLLDFDVDCPGMERSEARARLGRTRPAH